MSTETKSVLCDATPSWNGYNYQGKVGLYVCLVNILKGANKGIDSSDFDTFLNEHHIEYEWIEDFAIKKNDDYLSLHQVKHKAKNNFNDHVEAIATILNRKKGVLPHADIFKYFQFKSKKGIDVATAKVALTDEIIKYKLIDTNGLLDKNWQTKIPLIDKEYRENIIKCFIDFEHLSQKAFASSITYFHTADNVKPPTDDIVKIKNIPKNLVANLTHSKSLSCQGIFLSFDDPTTYKLALSDDALNIELEKYISKLIELIHKVKESDIDKEKTKLYRTALCALIDQHLAERHKHIRNKVGSKEQYLKQTKPSISYEQIVSVLKEKYEVHNPHYWNLVCRQSFEYAYEKQMKNTFSLFESSQIDRKTYNDYKIRLEFVRLNIISQYFPYNCIDFLKKLYPHETEYEQEHLYYSAISEPQKIKSVFFNFIKKVNKHSGKLTLKNEDNGSEYQPSCINFNEADPEERFLVIARVKKGLADNQGTQSSIFNNVDYIVVNSTGSEDVIPAGIEKFTEVEGYNQSNSTLKESDNITNKKEVSFMDSRKALGEIND